MNPAPAPRPVPTRVFARPAPDAPVLLTSLGSAAVLSADGRFALRQNTRGAELEWAGAYAEGIRLTGPWDLRLVADGSVLELSATFERLEATGWYAESVHRTPALEVRQTVLPLADPPGVVRRLAIRSTAGAAQSVCVESELVPFLAPVLIEGIKPYEYHVETAPSIITVKAHGLGLVLASDPLPDHLYLNRASWLGGQRTTEIESLMSDCLLDVPPDATATFTQMVWGGLGRTVENRPHAAHPVLADLPARAAEQGREWDGWRSRTPELSFPDAPWLEDAYRSAREGIRSLYVAPSPEMTGLVAGYPWYSAIWCRDLAWMLPAVVWLGDFDWAARSLRTVFRFQARSRLPIVAAEPGELPMQISPGPIFLFGTSDTSLYYPGLVEHLTAHSGDSALASDLAGSIERVGEWALAKVDPETGLFTNGNELAGLRATSQALGKIHYGFDAFDTTIWDSADRRDHAVDVQALFVQSMEAISRLARALDRGASVAKWNAAAKAVRSRFLRSYWWEDEGYLYDSVRHAATDGGSTVVPVAKLRPNALRAVSAGLLDDARSARVLARAGHDDLAAAWGQRTLSSDDPGYAPTAYHDGQVWSIATAWVADAALARGETERGISALRTLADRFVAEHGYAHECYRGDRAEPYDSCFLLGFSIAPFVSVLFERLWGLAVDARTPALSVRPRFPEAWRSATLRRLRVGTGHVGLRWTPTVLSVEWAGPRPLRISGPFGPATVEDGHPIDLPATQPPK